MKILIFTLLATICITVGAETVIHKGAQHRYVPKCFSSTHGWVFASIVGGVVVYEVIRRGRSERIIIERHEIIGDIEPQCTEWREIQTDDGKIYRERACRLEK